MPEMGHNYRIIVMYYHLVRLLRIITGMRGELLIFAPSFPMKKFLVTILALVYLTSTVGATLRLDCCMENLVSFAGDNKESKECSKDDHKKSTLAHEQKRYNAPIRIAPMASASIDPSYPGYSFHYVSSLTEAYPVNNAPPQQSTIPLFIFNCIYRI